MIYKNQKAFKKLGEGFYRSLPLMFGSAPKLSVLATGGINRVGGSRCVLGVLAAWREPKRICYDRERHCHGDRRRRFPNIRIDTGFRADLVVEDKVIVEIKSVESLAPVHKKQLSSNSN
ncbi:MAG TPA: GxxExxY protein [Candidatus Acidoferrales bacterium]|nr:GxxExxY protein [Candidatus Acidoferrales bacterium]